MPSYNKSPFAALPEKVYPGRAAYLFGAWSALLAPTQGVVNNVAITTNVATVTVLINSGNIPAVGSLITIQGTATGSGAFNVTNVALASVSITASTGAGTLTFALTHANVAAVADAGTFIVPQPEVGDALANGASVACEIYDVTSFNTPLTAQQVTAICSFPSLPTAATISLQGAITNQDAEYVTVATVATVAAGAVTSSATTYSGKFNFYRLLASSVSGGTNPTVVGKILA